MIKVSVLMPSLNVVRYIRECMESVISQTMKEMEVLCIDAGSTDGTLEILEEYAQKDRRVRLIKADKKSYGHQMNLGLKEAVGEYIGVVETDDLIRPKMYEELYAAARKNNADYVKSDFDIFTTLEDRQRIFLRYSLKKHSGITYDAIYTPQDFLMRKQTIDIFIWNGIYRRDFLLEKGIWFQETPGAAFQDCGFRYQVVLNAERGVFLEGSFYRYRRDNVDSSTYNKRCVLFNLAECKNLLRIAKKAGMESQEQTAFLARECAVIALAPYTELLMWGQPADGTKEALEGFRTILKDFIEHGSLDRASVTGDAWMEIRMFVENPDFYDYYAHLRAETAAQAILDFLHEIAKKRQVVLFGSGFVGSCAYCLLRNNGIQNIVSFCDNDERKWGSAYMGSMIISPKGAVERFPDAFYLITNAGHSNEIQKQLLALGVGRDQIMTYSLTTSPMDCTNMVMRCSSRDSVQISQ